MLNTTTIGYLIAIRKIAGWKDVIELDPQQSDCHSGKEKKIAIWSCHPTSGYPKMLKAIQQSNIYICIFIGPLLTIAKR